MLEEEAPADEEASVEEVWILWCITPANLKPRKPNLRIKC